MVFKNIPFLLVLLSVFSSCKTVHKINYNSNHLTASDWVVEQQTGGTVTFKDKVMEITDAKGCTVWFKHLLQGPISISYDATIIQHGGPYDRASDLNCFWMATDPNNPENFFKNSKNRDGKFTNYHELLQYYVGYGGHNNSKTRFRRYNGEQNRPLLAAHDLSDPVFMITPNIPMRVTLVADGQKVQYLINGNLIFELDDTDPYQKGYFGIRTVNNHMKIENLEIKSIHN
ncbi:MAG: hypothetical protein COB60_09465 [Flavobacteriaceae bacterium]|nr:MAG: hypothetical protein COB60_09465 [Flavobacteriaceae bacterium]